MSDAFRDELGEFGRGLLEAGETERPSTASRDALLAALVAAPAATLGAPAAAKAFPLHAASKWLVGGALAVTFVAGVWVGSHADPNRVAPSLAQEAPLPLVREAPVVAIPVHLEAPAAPQVVSYTYSPRAESTATSMPNDEPPTAPEPSVAPVPPTLAEEIAAIDAARAAVNTHRLDEARAALSHYEARYGRTGTLRPEAKLVTVQMHLAGGERETAAAVAESLAQAYPSSVAAHRAMRLLQESSR